LAVLLVASLPAAFAGISDQVYMVNVCKGTACTGYFEVHASDGYLNPATGEFSWYLGHDFNVQDVLGMETVATLKAYNQATGKGTFVTVAPPGGRSPYQVNLGFAVEAGDEDTTFSFGSAMLSFAAMNNPLAQADAEFTITDNTGDGATLTGLKSGGAAYRAQYNGFPSGTPFSDLLTAPLSALPFNGADAHPNSGPYATIYGVVTNMSSQIDFSLTAGDIASGASTFELLVPEPTAALLALVGAALLRRR